MKNERSRQIFMICIAGAYVVRTSVKTISYCQNKTEYIKYCRERDSDLWQSPF